MAVWGADLDDRFVTPVAVTACLAAGVISWGHAYALVGRLVLRSVGVAYDDLDDDLRHWAPTMDGPDSPATWAVAFHALLPQS